MVSEKGQVTIPKSIRDRLGIRPGQVLEFDIEGGRLLAAKAAALDPLEHVRGVFRDGRTTGEIMRFLRDEVEV